MTTLPKTFKIGRHTYVVHSPTMMAKPATRGEICYEMGSIQVGKQCNVTLRKYSKKERAEIFWHEVTHGILFDMGHPLAFNEKFVDAFSKRLNNAIHSATFD